MRKKVRRRYKCARCGRTSTSMSERVICPRKKPQCTGVMMELGVGQTTLDGKVFK